MSCGLARLPRTRAASEPGETTASGTTLEAGKYINDWIYMGVQQGMKPDSTAFVIQLELTPHSNIELKTDQSNTWGAATSGSIIIDE